MRLRRLAGWRRQGTALCDARMGLLATHRFHVPHSGVCFNAGSGTWNQNGTVTINMALSGYGMCASELMHYAGLWGAL